MVNCPKVQRGPGELALLEAGSGRVKHFNRGRFNYRLLQQMDTYKSIRLEGAKGACQWHWEAIPYHPWKAIGARGTAQWTDCEQFAWSLHHFSREGLDLMNSRGAFQTKSFHVFTIKLKIIWQNTGLFRISRPIFKTKIRTHVHEWVLL